MTNRLACISATVLAIKSLIGDRSTMGTYTKQSSGCGGISPFNNFIRGVNMQSDNYVVIQGWMCNELNLKGNDLLIFALIHGFSQDGESRFSGSRKYIANTFNISLPTVDKSIKSLLEKDLIEQHKIEKNGITFNSYNSLYPVKKLYRGSKETLHNKLDNNIENKVLSKDNTTNFTFGKKQIKQTVNLYTKCENLINAKTEDPELRKLLLNWLDMLIEKYRSRGKSLYTNVFKGKLNMLDKYDHHDWVDIVEYNLQRGYEGLYPIKNYYTDDARKRIEQLDSAEVMTEKDYENLKKMVEERSKNGLRTSF